MKYNSLSKTSPRDRDYSLSKLLPGDYPWKVLSWLAEDLRPYLTVEDQEYISLLTRNRDLEAVLDLSERWGLLSMPTTDGSLLEKAARYQLAALLKKFRFKTEREQRLLRAKEKFLLGESRCSDYNLEGYMKLACAEEQWMVAAFTYARSFLQKLLGHELPGPEVMTERSRHGPGATCDTEKGLVSNYHKFEKWPYQCTQAALGYARLAIENDERWLGALEDDYRTRFGIPKHVILNRQMFWDTVFEVVDGNRITFVPKDARVERSIAIEPTMNLYLQLGVDGYIRRRLKRWGVDLDSQEKNRRLAYLGSTDMVDPYVTIDLANASNSISLKVCELLLPKEWYNYLVALRSPKGKLGDCEISYEMISSMGNGYTFALESSIFTAMIYGVTRETLGSVNPKEWAVFGDDLIVRQSLSERLIESLANCGFEVNLGKSCLSGRVRESCGTDWFQGKLVRPVFLTDTPTDVSELFCDLNRLKRILSVRWGVEESKTESGLYRWIPEQFRDIVGPFSDEDFDSYIHCASPKSRYKRWVYKYKRLVYKPQKVKATSFFFRKLMHDLHPIPPPTQFYTRKGRLTSSGGRFNVFRRNALTLSTSYSVSSHWRSEYDEYRPG